MKLENNRTCTIKMLQNIVDEFVKHNVISTLSDQIVNIGLSYSFVAESKLSLGESEMNISCMLGFW
jgi:predicted nuclease of restriction endonuclease-like (RecB) superfamily